MSGERLLITSSADTAHAYNDEAVIVQAVTAMSSLFSSNRPEHQPIRRQIPQIASRARQVARELTAAIHPDIAGAEFWAHFHPHLASFSIAPALATHMMLEEICRAVDITSVTVRENPRSASWWAARENFGPLCREYFAGDSIRVKTIPGSLLHLVRQATLPTAAAYIGRREMREDLNELTRTAPQPSPTESDILFVGGGAAVADIINRIWQPLTEEHGLACNIVDVHHDHFTKAIARYDLPTIDFGAFVSDDIIDTARRKQQQWRSWWNYYRQRRSDVQSYGDLPSGVRTSVDTRMRVAFARRVQHWLIKSLAARDAIETLQPSVVVAFHQHLFPNSGLVSWAKERGIPCVTIQHGVVGDFRHFLPTLSPDIMLVWGQYAQELFGAIYGDSVQIHQTGHSLYDNLANREPAVRPEVAALRGHHHHMIVLATQPNEAQFFKHYSDWWIEHVAGAAGALDAALLLKLHPADQNHDLYRKVHRKHPDTVQIIEHGTVPLDDLLVAADLMITRNSTVVLEANILQTPVVTIDLTQNVEHFPFSESGGAVHVTSAEEILPALKDALAEDRSPALDAEKRDEFLRAHAGPIDGQATRRIVEHLERLVRR